MRSTELKHQAKLQEWAVMVEECRSSKLPVRQWCRDRGITASRYYRWERALLSTEGTAAGQEAAPVVFAALPAPEQTERKEAERSAAVRIGANCIEFYGFMGPELVKAIIEALRGC